jgi:3-oxoacyl-[acyl-carrier-protein] synthase III
VKSSAGALGARILGLGDYRPTRTLTNDDLAQMVDTSDEWIRTRVGVRSRRIAAEDETIVDMGAAAGGKALAASGLAPDDIDLVITATCTLQEAMPGAGTRIAARLAIPAPGAFDIDAACAGFCYGLSLANDAIRAGSARHVLVIGSEKLSALLDWTDRSTCIIFGDGAGAAVVGAADEPGIGPVVWGSNGEAADTITMTDANKIQMNGRAVFRWATTTIGDVAIEACRRAGVEPSELTAIVPHQANLRIVESIVKQLGAPDAIVARDIVDTGNTSAASVPLALARLAERGEIKSGDLALVVAFGAGLTYAGQVIACP